MEVLPSAKSPIEQDKRTVLNAWTEGVYVVHKRDLQTMRYRIIGTRYGPIILNDVFLHV